MRPPEFRRVASGVLLAVGALSGTCIAPTAGAAADPEPQAPTPQAPTQQAPTPQTVLQPGESYLAAGRRLLVAREPALAMGAYLSEIASKGSSFDALTGAGIAAYQRGLLSLARRYFHEANRLDPESAVGLTNLGVVLLDLKEYYPARNALRTAVALTSGENALALNNLNRAEAAIDEIEHQPPPDAALSREVVRLGSSEFSLRDAATKETNTDAPNTDAPNTGAQ